MDDLKLETPNSSPGPNREDYLNRLSKEAEWDVIVIGGGATGLGIALDATTRGYRTLLVEQSDFAKGTSSRSTKLVHGGVRYLAQGNVRLVREASIERGILHRNAPHLVRDQTFIVPVYSRWDRLKYTIGLKLYDWIAGRLGLGDSVFISRKAVIEALPGIKQDGLRGGVLYHDGQFDDARLAINLVQTILDNGGHAINYLGVTGLVKGESNKISGVITRDAESGRTIRFKAKAVINATGVFVDDILRMESPGNPPTIRLSQGIHLVIDRKFYPSPHALMIPKTSDGRVLFAVPWHNKVVVGTTDTPVDSPSLEPAPLEEEISFILETASAYFSIAPTRSDVLSVFAGLRPLAAPRHGSQKTREISRRHKVIVSPGKLFTILGGKWTTYRQMGEDMIDRVEKILGWENRQSTTERLPIHGSMPGVDFNNPFYFYGSDAERIPGLDNRNLLSQELNIHAAQVEWAVNQEMARTVEDVLSRRTRALLLDARECRRIAPEVARIMAELLKKDDSWVEKQLNDFHELSGRYIL